MNTNISSADRAIRVVVGLLVLGIGYYNHSWWALAGLPLLFTAAVRFCPAYEPLKLGRARRPDQNREP